MNDIQNSQINKEQIDTMIKNTDYNESLHTDFLRNHKKSEILRKEAIWMSIHLEKNIEKYNSEEKEEMKNECINKCPVLFANFPSVFNKIFNKELNMFIFYQYLNVMQKIENGELNHLEASTKISELTLAFYKTEKLSIPNNEQIKTNNDDKEINENNVENKIKKKNISWNDYSNLYLQNKK